MSAFIVISVKDNLNWIVDGIKDCRPHNPEVITYLSTGKIKKSGEGKYLYEYSAFSKHAGDGNADNTLARTVESDIPRNLFSNQIAQFLHVCENEGEQINIFLLDNPITDADFEHSSWLVDEIRAVYESHKATNFQLVRVLFSYQIDKPEDVNLQASKMILKQLTKIDLDDSDDFLNRILYIDNQNRSGAAMCLNKAEHNIMIPRMLCDLMMLLSNKDDSYNVANALGGQNRMFAVGYSECMYFHDDVFRYYDIAGRRDLTKYLLENVNTEESLDFEKHPIGLEDRLKRLEPKYSEVPFNVDISSYALSIDRAIDDILVSFREDIIGIRQEALNKAAEKDAEETKKRKISLFQESGKLSDFDVDIENDLDSIAEEAGIDISSCVVTDAYDLAAKEYPEYIDRKKIYEEYLVEDEEGEDYEGVSIDANIKAYNRLIRFIQTSQFKRYVRQRCEQPDSVEVMDNGIVDQPKKKICFLKRIFSRRPSEDTSFSALPVPPTVSRRIWHSLRASIASIPDMYAERMAYYALKNKADQMRTDLTSMDEEIRLFKLTSHCSSVDSLIDIDKLKEFHAAGREARLAKIVKLWNSRIEDNRDYAALFEDLEEVTKWDVFGFYYINWDEPFDFIKSIDLLKVCESLKRRSQPFVNTYTLGPNAENLTSYIFYTDNSAWDDDIKQKRITLKDDNKISCTFSRHICSKICMFQFLQMSHELIEGLVDCYEN